MGGWKLARFRVRALMGRGESSLPFLRKVFGHSCINPLTLLNIKWWVEFGFGGRSHSRKTFSDVPSVRKAA